MEVLPRIFGALDFFGPDGDNAPAHVRNGNFVLNKDSPLYDSSLVLALAPFAGAGFHNFAPSDVIVKSTVRPFSTNTIGNYGFKFERTENGAYATVTPAISISNGYTISLVYDALPNLNTSQVAYSDSVFQVHLGKMGSNNELGVTDFPSNKPFSPTVWPTIFPARVAVTYDGTTARCYLEGIEAGTVAASFSTPIEFILGDDANHRAWSPCLRFEVWQRVLPPAEIYLLHGPATQWEFYDQAGRVSYFFVPAGTIAKAGTDALGLALAESSVPIAVTLGRGDTLGLGLTAAFAILVPVAGADTAAAALSEAGALAVALETADALDLALTEATPELRAALARVDSLDLALTTSLAILAALDRGDTAALGLTEPGQVAALIQAADLLDAALDEGTVEILATLDRAEQLDLTMGEVSALFVRLVRGDTLGVATPEAAAVAALIAAADALGLSVSASATVAEIAALLAVALLALSHRAGTGIALLHRAATGLAVSHRAATDLAIAHRRAA